ncbi:MAG TPA: hypothetical protein VJC10_01980 [Patescibacteria group bacterium]|nr:hypothetical protein [Patescibacteria group bacterium]
MQQIETVGFLAIDARALDMRSQREDQHRNGLPYSHVVFEAANGLVHDALSVHQLDEAHSQKEGSISGTLNRLVSEQEVDLQDPRFAQMIAGDVHALTKVFPQTPEYAAVMMEFFGRVAYFSSQERLSELLAGSLFEEVAYMTRASREYQHGRILLSPRRSYKFCRVAHNSPEEVVDGDGSVYMPGISPEDGLLVDRSGTRLVIVGAEEYTAGRRKAESDEITSQQRGFIRDKNLFPEYFAQEVNYHVTVPSLRNRGRNNQDIQMPLWGRSAQQTILRMNTVDLGQFVNRAMDDRNVSGKEGVSLIDAYGDAVQQRKLEALERQADETELTKAVELFIEAVTSGEGMSTELEEFGTEHRKEICERYPLYCQLTGY